MRAEISPATFSSPWLILSTSPSVAFHTDSVRSFISVHAFSSASPISPARFITTSNTPLTRSSIDVTIDLIAPHASPTKLTANSQSWPAVSLSGWIRLSSIDLPISPNVSKIFLNALVSQFQAAFSSSQIAFHASDRSFIHALSSMSSSSIAWNSSAKHFWPRPRAASGSPVLAPWLIWPATDCVASVLALVSLIEIPIKPKNASITLTSIEIALPMTLPKNIKTGLSDSNIADRYLKDSPTAASAGSIADASISTNRLIGALIAAISSASISLAKTMLFSSTRAFNMAPFTPPFSYPSLPALMSWPVSPRFAIALVFALSVRPSSDFLAASCAAAVSAVDFCSLSN